MVEEVIKFMREYVNDPSSRTKEKDQKIKAVYRQLTGEILRINCHTCYVEALFKIKKIMEKKSCSYRLKPGALLRAFGDESKTCTNNNLTDELAEYHLRTNPGCRKLFSIVPEPEETDKVLDIVPPVTTAPEPEKVDPATTAPEENKSVTTAPKATRKRTSKKDK